MNSSALDPNTNHTTNGNHPTVQSPQQEYIARVLEGHEWLDRIAIETKRKLPIRIMNKIFDYARKSKSGEGGDSQAQTNRRRVTRTERRNPHPVSLVQAKKRHQRRTRTKARKNGIAPVINPQETVATVPVHSPVRVPCHPSQSPSHVPAHTPGPSNIGRQSDITDSRPSTENWKKNKWTSAVERTSSPRIGMSSPLMPRHTCTEQSHQSPQAQKIMQQSEEASYKNMHAQLNVNTNGAYYGLQVNESSQDPLPTRNAGISPLSAINPPRSYKECQRYAPAARAVLLERNGDSMRRNNKRAVETEQWSESPRTKRKRQ